MISESAAGFVAYLGAVFLPGLGLGELLGLWRANDDLGQRVALAFGLGLVADTVVLAIKTRGLGFLGTVARRIDPITVFSLLVAGLGLLLVSMVWRRKFVFLKRPEMNDLSLLIIVVMTALMVVLYLQKFPIFPEFQSGDYSQHVIYVEKLLDGTRLSGFGGLLYFGVEYQLAMADAMVGGQALVTIRQAMAILVILSPLLVYLVSSELFRNKWAALASTAVYSISSTVWFISVFDSGLYANFFGVLISIFFVTAFSMLVSSKRRVLWIVFLLALFAAYFSHYSTLTVMPSLLVLVLVQYKRARSEVMTYFYPAAISIGPVLIGALAYPTLTATLLGYVSNAGGTISGSTTVSNLLSFDPVLRYMAVEALNDWGFVLLLALGVCYTYGCLKSKNTLLLIFPLWFLSLVLFAPLNIGAWRFSYEALVPLTLMSGFGIYAVVRYLFARRVPVARVLKPALVALLLATIFYGSWGQNVVVGSLSNPGVSATQQRDVYNAIYWLKNNTPINSTYLSVTDWRLTYTNLLIGRPTFYKYFSDQNQTMDYAKGIGAEYVLITRQVTLPVPPLQAYFPWYSFQNESGFTQIYSNGDVRIYQVA